MKKMKRTPLSGIVCVFSALFAVSFFQNTSAVGYRDNWMINTGFDDSNLFGCVLEAYKDANGVTEDYLFSTIGTDGALPDSGLANITSLYCMEANVVSTSGIDKLVNLTRLVLDNNNINTINVLQNTKLSYLSLNINNISSLDISGLSDLTSLYVTNNQLSSLNLSETYNLTNLIANLNQLTYVYLGDSTKLEVLYVANNELDELDISKNPLIHSIATDADTIVKTSSRAKKDGDKYIFEMGRKFSGRYGQFVPVDSENYVVSYDGDGNAIFTVTDRTKLEQGFKFQAINNSLETLTISANPIYLTSLFYVDNTSYRTYYTTSKYINEFWDSDEILDAIYDNMKKEDNAYLFSELKESLKNAVLNEVYAIELTDQGDGEPNANVGASTESTATRVFGVVPSTESFGFRLDYYYESNKDDVLTPDTGLFTKNDENLSTKYTTIIFATVAGFVSVLVFYIIKRLKSKVNFR